MSSNSATAEAPIPAASERPGDRRSRRLAVRPVAVGWLLAVGIALLAWVFSNPVMAAPDEPANLTKALASGDGQWLGDRLPAGYAGYASEPPRRQAWYLQVSRSFSLPAKASAPAGATCFAFRKTSAACTDTVTYTSTGRRVAVVTPQGSYPPFLYAPLGLVARFGHSFREVTWLARLTGASLTWILFAAGVLVAERARGGRASATIRMAGIALATTPMVLFLGATVSTNGLEAAAGLATWLVALRLRSQLRWEHRQLLFEQSPSSHRGLSTALVWLLATLASAMSLSRILDPLFLVVILLTLLVLGPAQGRTSQPVVVSLRRLVLPLGVLAAAIVLTVFWDFVVMPHLPVDKSVARQAVHPLLSTLPEELRQAIGVFGWLDSRLPRGMYLAWQGAVAASVLIAVVLGNWRERAAVLLLPLASFACYMIIGMFVERQIDFGMQARYVLVPLIGIPLVAAEVVARRVTARRSLVAGQIAAVVVGLTLVGQAVAIFANLHRYAVGSVGSLFSWPSSWQAPDGNALWLCVSVIVGLLGVVVALLPAAGGTGRGRMTLSQRPTGLRP